MKIFNRVAFYLVASMLALSLVGCESKTPIPPRQECSAEIKIQHDIVYVDKEVPCKDTNVTCDFNGVGGMPIQKLLECVITQKHALAACRGNTIKIQ